jgi:hypothetical protein
VNFRNLILLLMALVCLPISAISQDKMVSKAPVKKTTTAKKMPPRDPKTGRFIKKEAVVVTAKKGPARDPKTGRFIKKDSGAVKMGAGNSMMSGSPGAKSKMLAGMAGSAKKGPARDPKTGKFIKSDKKK